MQSGPPADLLEGRGGGEGKNATSNTSPVVTLPPLPPLAAPNASIRVRKQGTGQIPGDRREKKKEKARRPPPNQYIAHDVAKVSKGKKK